MKYNECSENKFILEDLLNNDRECAILNWCVILLEGKLKYSMANTTAIGDRVIKITIVFNLALASQCR